MVDIETITEQTWLYGNVTDLTNDSNRLEVQDTYQQIAWRGFGINVGAKLKESVTEQPVVTIIGGGAGDTASPVYYEGDTIRIHVSLSERKPTAVLVNGTLVLFTKA